MMNRDWAAWGAFANTPETMLRRIRDPQSVDSKTATPNPGVTDTGARDDTAGQYM
jgi:hypothetical protein